MALEIERKFLPRNENWRQEVIRSVPMKQAYFGGDGVSVRIRITGESALINIKECRLGMAREEFEYPIPLEDGHHLFQLARGGRVEKTRHYIPCDGLTWEIDEFEGDNAGLVVAEVELDSPDQPVELPDWAGEEVTDQDRYYNVALATHPYRLWNTE